MDDLDPALDQRLSPTQQILILVLEFFSASLSLVGSSIIVYKILRDRPQTPYDRIMLGLSTFDIIASITWPLISFLQPPETESIVAFGNATTCQISGFLTQLSVGAWWYNCILSYYFLLTVLSQLRRKDYVGNCELWMHLTILWFPITGIMGFFRGWYGVVDFASCWIVDEAAKWIIAGIPTFFTILALLVNNIVIFVVVQKSLRSSDQGAVQNRLKRESLTLMLLYVGGFYLSILPTLIKLILEEYSGLTAEDEKKIFPLIVVDTICLPLQGFFNFFIYIRPMYMRFRNAHPDQPAHFILRKAVFSRNAPSMKRRRNANRMTQADTEETISAEFADINPNKALFNAKIPSNDPSSNDESSEN